LDGGDRDYRLLRLDDHDGRALGAAMPLKTRFDRPGGIGADNLPGATVLDWVLVDTGRAMIKALLQAYTRTAVAKGGEVMEFATGESRLANALRRHGFLKAGGYRIFLHCKPDLAERLGRPGEFYWEDCHVEDNFTW
jgi:hypothetical protein